MKDEYRTLIDRAFASKADLVISNAKPDHATYTMAKFLDNAERVVRIYLKSLPRFAEMHGTAVPVFASDDVLHAARSFLSKEDTVLMILTDDDLDADDQDEHPLVRLATEMQQRPDELGGTLWIAKAPPGMGAKYGDGGHWQVMDTAAYRLEHDAASKRAHVNFGAPEVAGELARAFNAAAKDADTMKVVSAA